MNLLGAIGTLVNGSGLFETICGDNAVVHMRSGKAKQYSVLLKHISLFALFDEADNRQRH